MNEFRMFQKRVTENSRVELHFDDEEVDIVDLDDSHSMEVHEGPTTVTISFDVETDDSHLPDIDSEKVEETTKMFQE